jgi:glucoamylase
MQAPGGPGAPPSWGPGRKQGFGTAPGLQSKVWFTIANGSLSDCFFPSLDRPVLTRLRFIVAATGSPPLDDSEEATHEVRWLQPGVPAFTVQSTHPEYRLSKDVLADPASNTILIAGNFSPELPDLRLYVQCEPHLAPGTEGNSAKVLDSDPPVLIAEQDGVWMALVGSFSRATVGYLNASDLFVNLHDSDGALTDSYEEAGPGNVALGAELSMTSGPFQIAIGFAHSAADAEEVAHAALRKGTGQAKDAFERGWRSQTELPPNLVRVSGDGGQLARASLAVLRCLEDKSRPGAFVAAPCAPWGESCRDGDQVYHVVWPRDLVHIAMGFINAEQPEPALRALAYLERMQRPDGSWAQNWTLDGKPHWNDLELDQVALPMLLAWRLGVAGQLDHDPYPNLVRPAATFLLRWGPLTPLDRWEDAGGLSTSTLAVCAAALIVAAEFAGEAGEHVAAAHLRHVADYWNERVDSWCFSPQRGHYVRLGSDPNVPPAASSALSIDFLELVRFGLRAPNHPLVKSTVQAVDALLKVDFEGGSAWRRYERDAYGERDDGSPWGQGGRGRPWPLLAAERALYELAAGNAGAPFVSALESFAGPELILPEQVWDQGDIPARKLFRGRATNSVAPLGWAHADYLGVLAAIAGALLPDVVAPAKRRYVDGELPYPAFVWSHAHQITTFVAGREVKLQLPRPGIVRWTPDGWATYREVAASDTTLGFWVADLPTQIMRPGAVMEWTAHYATGWEGRNYALRCVAET